MRDFFNGMNLPRLIILVCLLASVVLGYFVYERTEYLAKVERDLVSVENVIREIQQNAMELERLQELSRDDRFKDNDASMSFFQSLSADGRVQLGQIIVDNGRDKPQGKGVVDKVYTVKPALKEMSFDRQRIGNFLFLLEETGNHAKVTSIDLEPHGKFRPGEITNDQWDYTIKVTSRTKRE